MIFFQMVLEKNIEITEMARFNIRIETGVKLDAYKKGLGPASKKFQKIENVWHLPYPSSIRPK